MQLDSAFWGLRNWRYWLITTGEFKNAYCLILQIKNPHIVLSRCDNIFGIKTTNMVYVAAAVLDL
jgi:hypothetical protein